MDALRSPEEEDEERGVDASPVFVSEEEEARPLSTEDDYCMHRRAAEAASVTAIAAMVAYENACDIIESQENLGNLLARAMNTEDYAMSAEEDVVSATEEAAMSRAIGNAPWEDYAELFAESDWQVWDSPATPPGPGERLGGLGLPGDASWAWRQSRPLEEEEEEEEEDEEDEESEEEEAVMAMSDGDDEAVAVRLGGSDAADEEGKEAEPLSMSDGDDVAVVVRQGGSDAADALAHLASCCPPSEGMPDGFRTSKCLAPSLPWTDHWWAGPMEVAALRVLAQPQGRGHDGTWHDMLVLKAVMFPLLDGRALVWVQALD